MRFPGHALFSTRFLPSHPIAPSTAAPVVWTLQLWHCIACVHLSLFQTHKTKSLPSPLHQIDLVTAAHAGWGAVGQTLDKLPAVLKHRLLRHLQYDGVPMTVLAEWFRIQGYGAEVVSAGAVNLDVFRADVERAFRADVKFEGAPGSNPSAAALSDVHDHGEATLLLMVNYSRSALGQRMFSDGHYAPVAGLHPGLDKVLLLEVNSRRYPSVWVDVSHLWAAVHTRVGNGAWRGYLRILEPPQMGRQGHVA